MARIFASVLAVVALTSAPVAQAYCRMTTSQVAPPAGECQTAGIPLEWKRRCISYSIDRSGSANSPNLSFADISRIVGLSVQTWMDVSCDDAPIEIVLDETDEPSDCHVAEFNREGANVNTFTFVSGEDWEDRRYDPNAYALTTVWHSVDTGQIYDVDMEVNEARGNPYTECPVSEGCDDGERVDLQNVVTHEMGHLLGLAHSQQATVTMSAASPPGEVTKRVLRTDDVDGICVIYEPGTVPAECDFAPRGGLDLSCGEDGMGTADDSGGCTVATAHRRGGASVWLLFGALAGLVLRWRRSAL